MKLHRQVVLLVLAALLPLVVLSAVLGAGALRQGQRDMERDAQARLSVIAAGVSRELNAQVEVLQAIAASPLLDAPVDPGRFKELAGRLVRDHPLWLDVSLTSREGDRLIDVPALPAGIGRRVIDRFSHAEAVRTGLPVIGRVMRSPRGNVAFAVFVPVIRGGAVVSVLNAVVRPAAVHDFLVANGLPSSWRAGVLDSSQRVVTRTLAPDVATHLGSQEARDAMTRSPEGSYRAVGSDNLPLIVEYKVLPESGWSVHVAMPRALYEAPFRKAALLVGAGAIVSLVLVGLFMWLLARELLLRQREAASVEESRRMEALGRMTGGVAHDFNNLLMIMQGSADLLRRRLPNEARTTALIEAIVSAAQRGQSLTRQLLAFGRRSTHEPVSFRLQDRATDMRELLRRSVPPEVSVSLDVPADTWPIHADPNALEVALINLAVNAGDAMPEGGALSIVAANGQLHRQDDITGLVGEFVTLSVSDTGVGIPAEHLPHVFEPFYTTKPTGKGTGLGLSQVYGFAKQSNGAVIVNSKPGQGATITIYLPRGGPVSPIVPPEADDATAQADGRALLVEDNEEVGAVAEAMLGQAGYTVVLVRDGQSALDAAAQGSFDIVLTDIMLGSGISGLDVAAKLRAGQPDLPIVLMTGYSHALAASNDGAFPVLSKPFDQRSLSAALARARRVCAAGRPVAMTSPA